jgi:hypothetical protein
MFLDFFGPLSVGIVCLISLRWNSLHRLYPDSALEKLASHESGRFFKILPLSELEIKLVRT